MQSTSLRNQLLIAMPNLQDPNFSRTVTYICEHSDEGAMGIVINRPTELKVADVFKQMQIIPDTVSKNQTPVYVGGPVDEDRGFVLHTREHDWKSTLDVNDELSVTTSRDILEAMAHDKGPQKSLIALGYAGWVAGQLEEEILNNAWLSGPANNAILFDIPADQRWEASAKLLGVDLNLLSSESGHA